MRRLSRERKRGRRSRDGCTGGVVGDERGAGGVDDHGSGAGGGEAGGVGRDVVDGVGGNLRGVDHDVAHQLAVEEVFQAEVVGGGMRLV
jgi:hypothetical protein